MTGLALEGGGTRGSYQAGVYAALLECGIKIDGVCGTSIGALNAALIASNKGENLASLWRKFDIASIFGFSKDFIEARNHKRKKINSLEVITKEITKILLQKGIELEGLKKVLDENLDIDDLIASEIDFGLVTVRLKDLKPLYLWKKEMPKDKIKEYIIASSYLPLFKMEKIIDDSYYLDGGFYDLGPVNMLLDKGYETVYLVKVHGVGITRHYDKNANVIVIESKRGLGGILDLNHNRIEENIMMGYYDAIRVLKKLDGYFYVFKNKSDRYYEFINRKVSKKQLRRIKNFFHTESTKEATIKALEYIMEKENINYYEIYKPIKVIKKLKKNLKKHHFIYEYIKNLRYL